MQVIGRTEVFRHGILYWHSGVEHQTLLVSAKTAILHLRTKLAKHTSVASTGTIVECLKGTTGHFSGKAAELLVDTFVSFTGTAASGGGVSSVLQSGKSADLFVDAFLLFLYFQAYTCDSAPGKSPSSFARSQDHWPSSEASGRLKGEGSAASQQSHEEFAVSPRIAARPEDAQGGVTDSAPGVVVAARAATGVDGPRAEGNHERRSADIGGSFRHRGPRDLAAISVNATQHIIGRNPRTPSPRKTALETRPTERAALATFFRENLADMIEIVFGSLEKGRCDTITLAQVDTLGLYLNAFPQEREKVDDGQFLPTVRVRDLSSALPIDRVTIRSGSVKSIRKSDFCPWLLAAMAGAQQCEGADAHSTETTFGSLENHGYGTALGENVPFSCAHDSPAGMDKQVGSTESKADGPALCHHYGPLRLSKLRGTTEFSTDANIAPHVAIDTGVRGDGEGKLVGNPRSAGSQGGESIWTEGCGAVSDRGLGSASSPLPATAAHTADQRARAPDIAMASDVTLCEDTSVYALSASCFAYVAGCIDSTVVLGAVGSVLSVENCERTTIVCVASRLRICNCVDCVFYTSTCRPPLLSGDNRGLTFAPFNTSFPGLRAQMRAFPQLLPLLHPHHGEWLARRPLSLTATGAVFDTGAHVGGEDTLGPPRPDSKHEREALSVTNSLRDSTLPHTGTSSSRLHLRTADLVERSATKMEQKKQTKVKAIARFAVMDPGDFSLCSVPVQGLREGAKSPSNGQRHTYPVVGIPQEYLKSLSTKACRVSALQRRIKDAITVPRNTLRKHDNVDEAGAGAAAAAGGGGGGDDGGGHDATERSCPAQEQDLARAIGGHFWVSAISSSREAARFLLLLCVCSPISLFARRACKTDFCGIY